MDPYNLSYIKKLQASLEATSDAVYWGNALGEFEYVNERACQMLGYTKEEFKHLTVFDIDKNFKFKDLELGLSDTIEKKQDHNYIMETFHQTKNGESIPVEVNSTRVWIDSKWSVLSFVRDISKRKQWENDLLKKQRLLINSYRIAKIGAWELDLETLNSVWNNEYFLIMGLDPSKDKASLETFNHYVHPEDKEKVELHLKEIIKTKKFTDLEFRFLLADESVKNIIITGDLILDEKGKPVRLFGIIQDITERKQSEQAIIESEKRMKRIFAVAPVGMGIVKDRIIYEINSHVCKTSGYSKEELIGASSEILYPDKEEYERIGKILYQSKDQKGISNVETMWRRKDGEQINILMGFALFDSKDPSKGAIATTMDITEQKKYQQQLAELNASKDKFFRIIGHDLRNPFGSIMGLSKLIVEQFADFSEQNLREMLAEIYKSSETAYNLLDNLLAWSRSQSGNIEFEPTQISVENLVNNIINLLAGHARQKEIVLQINIEEGLLVFADENMLSTIIRNLASNAIKFTNKYGIVTVAASANSNGTIISVTDTGIGISKENIDKLFRIDEEYSTLGTNKEKGTGLGLILCKEFVDKHNGVLHVESKPGKGSTFSFSIPGQ